jgi:hypothetical protein
MILFSYFNSHLQKEKKELEMPSIRYTTTTATTKSGDDSMTLGLRGGLSYNDVCSQFVLVTQLDCTYL